MLKTLETWNGKVEVNGVAFDSVDFSTLSVPVKIHLVPKALVERAAQPQSDNRVKAADGVQEYKITVRPYMTKPSEPGFDFMAKWNNNIPMPLRTMVGTIEKETRGMVYMKLHGQGEPVITCMRCGRNLTNPISRHYGIGPECMSKLGFMVDINDVDTIKKKLVDVTWEGWIIKSAITDKEEV